MTGLVDAVNDGVITIDAEGKVVLFNRAAERLFGAPATEAIGGSVDRFIPRRPRTPEAARTQELQFGDVAGGEVRELFGRRADGQEFPLEVSLSRHETERGPLLTAVLRDVTGLQTARAERQAREALEASSRAKTEFLSRRSMPSSASHSCSGSMPSNRPRCSSSPASSTSRTPAGTCWRW
jgi:PAS domain S-box-containing protein